MGIKYLFDKITFVPSNYYEWTLMATILSAVVLVILTLEAIIIERKTIKYMLGYFKREKKESIHNLENVKHECRNAK